MAKIPSPLHAKGIPARVSKPTQTAEAAATIAETAAPVARRRVPAKTASAVPPRLARATPPVETTPPPAAVKAPKAHKPKLVRDSFTMPKDEYQVIDALKQRALGQGKPVRKSELLRAGIQALAALDDPGLLRAIAGVPTLKTGRPKKG